MNYLKKIVKKSGLNSISRPAHEPIYQYLSSSDVFVHSGCTTAIQARLINKPTVYLRSVNPGRSVHVADETIINSVNNDLYKNIKETANKNLKVNDKSFTDFTHKILDNLCCENLSCFEKINEIVNIFLNKKKTDLHRKDTLDNLKFEKYLDKISNRTYPKKYKSQIKNSMIFNENYLKHKFGLFKFGVTATAS